MPAVGNRCAFVAANGAVAFHNAWPSRKIGLLRIFWLLQLGYSADKMVRELLDTEDTTPLRQIGILDEDGRAATLLVSEIWIGAAIVDSVPTAWCRSADPREEAQGSDQAVTADSLTVGIVGDAGERFKATCIAW